jgi:hypothetical protein
VSFLPNFLLVKSLGRSLVNKTFAYDWGTGLIVTELRKVPEYVIGLDNETTVKMVEKGFI